MSSITKYVGVVYEVAALVTFAFLTFFDGYTYTFWNWIFVIPINIFLSQIWPIYWLILRPLMGS
jgi:hypothetical protein